MAAVPMTRPAWKPASAASSAFCPTSRADSLLPGDEYDLVDEFAEMLGIRGWFDWIPDGV